MSDATVRVDADDLSELCLAALTLHRHVREFLDGTRPLADLDIGAFNRRELEILDGLAEAAREAMP